MKEGNNRGVGRGGGLYLLKIIFLFVSYVCLSQNTRGTCTSEGGKHDRLLITYLYQNFTHKTT